MSSERLWSRSTKVFLLTELLFKVVEKALFLAPTFLFKQKFNCSLIYLLSMGCLQRQATTVTFSNTLLGIQGLMFLLTELRRLQKPRQPEARDASDAPPAEGEAEESPELLSPDRLIEPIFETPDGSPTTQYDFQDRSLSSFGRSYSSLREVIPEAPLKPGEAEFRELEEAVNNPAKARVLLLAKVSLLQKILAREGRWPELNCSFRAFCDDVSSAPAGSFWVSLSGKSRLALERSNLYKAECRLEASLFDTFWSLDAVDPPSQEKLEQLPPNAYWDPNVFLIYANDAARLGSSLGLTERTSLILFFYGPGVLRQTSRFKDWAPTVGRYYRLNTKVRLLRFRIADLFEFSPVTIDYRDVRHRAGEFLRPFWVFKTVPRERTWDGVAGLAPVLDSSPDTLSLVLSYTANARLEGRLTRLRQLPGPRPRQRRPRPHPPPAHRQTPPPLRRGRVTSPAEPSSPPPTSPPLPPSAHSRRSPTSASSSRSRPRNGSATRWRWPSTARSR